MKYACRCIDSWPTKLSKLKALCGFFRVKAWRHVIVRSGAQLYEGLEALLKSFTAKFLKWRYETLYNCFGQLDKLRVFCTTVLVVHLKEWFSSFKDSDLLNAVYDALLDNELWVFVTVFFKLIFEPLELARRWGLVCKCCREERNATFKRSKCVMASRRLPEARKFLQGVIQKLVQTGNNIDFQFAEGVEWIARSVAFTARKVSADLRYKTTYLNNPPWLIAECDDPEIAAECARLLQLGDTARLTPLELEYRECLVSSLEAFVKYLK